MKIDYLSTILKTNMDIVVLTILALSIVIFGGIAVYLAEHHHEGAIITKIGDALWWAVVTVATVGPSHQMKFGSITPKLSNSHFMTHSHLYSPFQMIAVLNFT